ncbi:calcium/proton exchanger [Desulfobacterota bacterium AH_259_B03_O07]|nr:calcium/proton exchanger [Desulfobacterota bacterium AH_259_B03_O07]
MKLGYINVDPLGLLLIFLPISIALDLIHASPVWIFITSALSIIPLAGFLGKATEELAKHVGPGIGGLLNATFGNAAELIIAIMALRRGLFDIVKASITGSIIGNILLVLGLSVLVGGLRFKKQTFNQTASSLGSTLLALSTIGLVIPALFHIIIGKQKIIELELSLFIAIILFFTYLLSLIFLLYTHKHLYIGKEGHSSEKEEMQWTKKKSILILFSAVVGIAIMSELLVGAVEHTAHVFGMTDVFIGVILVAIIGNAAEHSTAILVAYRNKMDLAMNIAIGSSIQIALLVTPVLIFLSYLFGTPMDLIFTTLEVVSIGLAVWIVTMIAHDGESNWMEGVQLLAVYLILAITFYFLP